jgi:hypothetical protein
MMVVMFLCISSDRLIYADVTEKQSPSSVLKKETIYFYETLPSTDMSTECQNQKDFTRQVGTHTDRFHIKYDIY